MRYSSKFTFLNLTLVMALFTPRQLLGVPLLMAVLWVLKSGAKNIHYLLIGLCFLAFYSVLGTTNIRLILPFVILFGLSSSVANENSQQKISIIFYLFCLITIVVAALQMAELVNLNDYLNAYYDFEEVDDWNYHFESRDWGTFRTGSIYLNPNQWAFLGCMLAIFMHETKQITLFKIVLLMIMMILTSSRSFMLIIFFISFFNIRRNSSMGRKLITILPILILLPLAMQFDSRLTQYDVETTVFQAVLKFSFLEQFFSQKSVWALLFGSGSLGDSFQYDADLGYILQLFGLVGGSLIIVTYIWTLSKSFSWQSILLLVFLSMYGTILTNSRIGILYAILSMSITKQLRQQSLLKPRES